MEVHRKGYLLMTVTTRPIMAIDNSLEVLNVAQNDKVKLCS